MKKIPVAVTVNSQAKAGALHGPMLVRRDGEKIVGYGMLAGDDLSEIVNGHYGYGLFVIILVPNGNTSSYESAEAAAEDGWADCDMLTGLVTVKD